MSDIIKEILAYLFIGCCCFSLVCAGYYLYECGVKENKNSKSLEGRKEKNNDL